jgi:DNA-binding response OmpR family regulator
MKLFIIESDKELLTFLETSFQQEGITYESASLYEEASEKLSLYEYDCIVLSAHLPKGKSMQLLAQAASANKSEGIILLSKQGTIEERIQALDLGADDFMTVPIHFLELMARIRAVIRRKRFSAKNHLYYGNLVIDLLSNTVKVWDTPLHLTKKEYELLLYFIANKEKSISKATLTEYLWGDGADNMDSFNLLFTHIKNMRRKLSQAKAELEIKNVYGVGYQIIEL